MSNSDLMDALEGAMKEAKEKRERWYKEHPDEKYPDVCPRCGGTGIRRFYKDIDGNDRLWSERYDPGSYEYVEACSCVKAGMSEQFRNNKRFSNVPKLYKDAMFNNFKTDIYKQLSSKQLASVALHTCQKFVTRFDLFAEHGMGLYIWSKARGSGKTRLASTIANELTSKGIRTKYVSASDFLNEIQGSWKDKDVTTNQVIENYIKPKLLIIDDLGIKGNQDWISDNITNLVDKRYVNKTPTVITSNYDVMELPLNTRATDRIGAVCKNISLPNESIRQIQKASIDDAFEKIFRGEEVDDDV